MSDIVERLDRYEAERDPEVSDEAAAEIRRLRSKLDDWNRRFVSVDDVLKAKNREDEIERLQIELQSWKKSYADLLKKKESQIDRLRETLSILLDPSYHSMTFLEVVRWLDDLRVRVRNILAKN